MLKVIPAALALTCASIAIAHALVVVVGDTHHAGGGAYTGPGDVKASASMWWGLRAYSAATRGNAVANVCDNTGGTDVTCADVLSDATTGLVLNAPVIGGVTCDNATHPCTIKTWYDQANGGSHTNDITQGSISSRAHWQVSAIGSKACSSWVGSGQLMTTGTVTSVSQPYTASTVAERTGHTTAQNIIINNGTTNFYLFFAGVVNKMATYAGGGGELDVTAADSSPHAAQGIYSGASSLMYIDGSASSTFDIGSGGTGTVINMGALAGNTANLEGLICEVGIWPVAFSGGEQANMDSNQRTFWGF